MLTLKRSAVQKYSNSWVMLYLFTWSRHAVRHEAHPLLVLPTAPLAARRGARPHSSRCVREPAQLSVSQRSWEDASHRASSRDNGRLGCNNGRRHRCCRRRPARTSQSLQSECAPVRLARRALQQSRHPVALSLMAASACSSSTLGRHDSVCW